MQSKRPECVLLYHVARMYKDSQLTETQKVTLKGRSLLGGDWITNCVVHVFSKDQHLWDIVSRNRDNEDQLVRQLAHYAQIICAATPVAKSD